MNATHWTQHLALLLTRLTFGGLMLVNHGMGKMERLLEGGTIRFADPLGIGAELSLALAAGAETVRALLLALGLFTRLNAIPLMVTMVVAAFMIHSGDQLPDKEPALMYLAAYAALFLMGGGDWSLQALFSKWMPKNSFVRFLLS